MISTKAIIQVKAATQSCYSKQMPKIAPAAQPRKLFASSERAAVATCFVSFFVLASLVWQSQEGSSRQEEAVAQTATF